ncbi:MAG: cytochrome c biogenesis protein CcsA [Desulfobulbus oligotrophicus]|jgi:hypothetical protein|nr:cytochrome c biogenesis protein CcsA [Desulfobulbus oligotrophicus]
MTIAPVSLYWALALYAAALVVLRIVSRRLLLPVLGAGLVVNCLAVAYRYSQAWPMLPMHLAPVLTPAVLACLVMVRSSVQAPPDTRERQVRQLALLFMFVCLLAAQLFPKDFYLSFLRSDSIFAHAMLFAGTVGRACFLLSIAWSTVFFIRSSAEERSVCMRRALSWAAWGVVFWTLSMFSGEMWSYLGWGTPVVWDDPAILLMMAAWFLYITLLHLHFSRAWGLRARALFFAMGGFAAIVLSLLADFGPFRPPW